MDDPEVAETFRLLKKRDLSQTYSFKMACREFGPPKCRNRIIIAPPMPKPYKSSPSVLLYGGGELVMSQRVTEEKNSRRVQEEKREEHTDWLSKRRAFRKALDGLGNLDSWFYNKPDLTKMESNVMERRKQIRETTPSEELVSDVQNDHSQLSTLGGLTGCAVDHFRDRCLEDYLSSLKQCQRHGLPISQATLKRVLLHPEDVSAASALPSPGMGRRGWMSYSILPQKKMEDDDNIDPKEISQLADSNAFWPGHDGHMRLYLPAMSNRHESVLFSRVEHTPVPCNGHWPINQAGYYTSGDINRHKVYTL
ncbi:uncharacterized protein si:dkey-197j19.5 isoform X2 [Trichomycterus rosablanca]|uniref:uncharacterized protein si:dkey-197j19.5 isoform X2 n=1 Tax=Trichomycterus rosablanca TaxID=2290929 RepID=UPI002F35CCFF